MSDRRRGWCPGALRPMRTGDGLLVRVRITGGVVPPALAQALAAAARDFGNGLIDLSARANLQLRGVGEATLLPLQARLAALGLLDADAAGETVRNVLASPLAGLDPAAPIDAVPFAAALERELAANRRLHALPAKFLFLIDGGGGLPLDGVEADVRFVAAGGEHFAVEAGGAALGLVAAAGLVPAAAMLAEAFLTLRIGEERRFRDVVGRVGAGPIEFAFGSAGLAGSEPAATLGSSLPLVGRDKGWGSLTKGSPCPEGPPPPYPSPQGGGERPASRMQPLSAAAVPSIDRLAGYIPAAGCFAAAIPFGRLTAAQLDGLAALAAERGSGLRLTPWRAILLAPVAEADAPTLAEEVAGLGLVVDATDARLAVAACPGRPACASGEGETQRDATLFAQALAPHLGPGVTVHVSGCPKGCARRAPATLMLVAGGGRYGLAFHATAMSPSATPLMPPDEMAAHLAGLDPSTFTPRSPKNARP